MKNKFKPITLIFLFFVWAFGRKKIELGCPNFGCKGYINNRKYYTFKRFCYAIKFNAVHDIAGEAFESLTIKQIYDYKI